MMIIELEDRGQDFTEFVVNDENVIVEARPFQTWVWAGLRIAPREARTGMFLSLFRSGNDKPMKLRYRIIGVRQEPAKRGAQEGA